MNLKSEILLKTIVWRTLSFSIALVTARIWFGDWHVSLFTLYAINKARNGAVLGVKEILSKLSFQSFLTLIASTIIAAGLAVILTVYIGRIASKINRHTCRN